MMRFRAVPILPFTIGDSYTLIAVYDIYLCVWHIDSLLDPLDGVAHHQQIVVVQQGMCVVLIQLHHGI